MEEMCVACAMAGVSNSSVRVCMRVGEKRTMQTIETPCTTKLLLTDHE